MDETQMEKLFDQLNNKTVEFGINARKAINGNKAAGARSRKISFEIEAILKRWRIFSNPESVRK